MMQAVKEFSKSRLRKRAQSNLLRNAKSRPLPGHFTAGKGFNSPLHRREPGKDNNSLDLIRQEIAIMKKLNHPNVVNLIEVLDDPDEDSLYMVMEMCKKGVVMHVGLDQTADPYSDEQCRFWFRDMILGLEYCKNRQCGRHKSRWTNLHAVHAQGIIHRDIKPDNCLITDDDTLKIVDFGVSEMFEKNSDMNTAKSAGSPAFMPPELCVAKHGEVSGRACDIWSMGVTLYCLRFGRIPFEKTGMLDLYESIKNDDFDLSSNVGDDFTDLMKRVMEKDPEKRIRMEELREHPWVTKQGADPLLSRGENVANLVEPPTEEELNHAITGNVGRLLVVMKAVKRFKQLLVQRRPELMESIFGNSSRFVQPPLSINPLWRTHSSDLDDRKPTEYALAAERIHREIRTSDSLKKLPERLNMAAIHGSDTTSVNDRAGAAHEAEMLRKSSPLPASTEDGKCVYKQSGRGQAHDPLEDTLYLGVGTGTAEPADPGSFAAVSESPGATDFNVYERAYQEEIDRIVTKQGEDKSRYPTLFLTRRVEHIKELRDNELLVDRIRNKVPEAANVAFKKLVEQAKSNVEYATSFATPSSTGDPAQGTGLKKMVEQAKENYEAASSKISTPASSLSQDDTPRTRFGITKLVDKVKQNIEAARTAKTDTSNAR